MRPRVESYRSRLLIVMLFGDPRNDEPRFCAPPISCVEQSVLCAPHLIIVHSISNLCVLQSMLSRLHLSQSTLICMSCSTMFFVFALPFAMLVSPYVAAWSLLPLLPARSSSSV